MILTLPTFTAFFPEFSGPNAPDPAVFAVWEAQAENDLNAQRFGSSYPLALALYVAHQLALSGEAARVTATGGVLGSSVAAISSKSVGGVSVSYDTSDAAIAGAGEWNSTGYGQRLYRMLKSYGMGSRYFPGRRPPPVAGLIGGPYR